MAISAFEHDEAADWLAGFETDGPAAIEAALTLINEMEKDDFIEATDGTFGLLAAELVAAARDEDYSRIPKNLHAAIEAHEDAINAAKLSSAARKAVTRIAKNSELKDSAVEEGEGEEWAENLGELLERLRG